MTYVQVAINGILLGGLYLLMAQGLNLIFGVMRIVNFAHGIIIVVAGLIVYSLAQTAGVSPFAALPVVVVVMVVFGLAIERILLERVKGTGVQRELVTLIVTFGLSYILINVAQSIWGSGFRGVPYLQSSWELAGLRLTTAPLVGFLLAIAFSFILYWWLNSTLSGKSVRATSQTALGAETCGINTQRVRMCAFATGCGLAGAAGMLLVVTQPISPEAATGYTMISFVVIALGGLGNYAGAAVGALIVGLAQTFVGYSLGITAQNAVPYVLLLLVMLLRPGGLLPARAR